MTEFFEPRFHMIRSSPHELKHYINLWAIELGMRISRPYPQKWLCEPSSKRETHPLTVVAIKHGSACREQDVELWLYANLGRDWTEGFWHCFANCDQCGPRNGCSDSYALGWAMGRSLFSES